MIAKCDGIVAHGLHQSEFKGFFADEHMKERSHRKITRIENQDGMGSFFSGVFDDGGDTGPAAQGFIGMDHEGLIVDFRRKSLKMRVHIIGVHDSQQLFSGPKIR